MPSELGPVKTNLAIRNSPTLSTLPILEEEIMDEELQRLQDDGNPNHDDAGVRYCEECRGTGRKPGRHHDRYGRRQSMPCPSCDGTGVEKTDDRSGAADA